MNIELNHAEQNLLTKILTSYLSQLRHTIAATKRGTGSLHEEEDLIKLMQLKVSQAS